MELTFHSMPRHSALLVFLLPHQLLLLSISHLRPTSKCWNILRLSSASTFSSPCFLPTRPHLHSAFTTIFMLKTSDSLTSPWILRILNPPAHLTSPLKSISSQVYGAKRELYFLYLLMATSPLVFPVSVNGIAISPLPGTSNTGIILDILLSFTFWIHPPNPGRFVLKICSKSDHFSPSAWF